MLSVFLLNSGTLLFCAFWVEMDARRSEASGTDGHPCSFEYTHTHTHSCVLQRGACVLCAFSNLSPLRASQRQCYYRHWIRRATIGVHCVWDIHYSWFGNYFHTFGCLWSEEMGVNNHSACLFIFACVLLIILMVYRCALLFIAPPCSLTEGNIFVQLHFKNPGLIHLLWPAEVI